MAVVLSQMMDQMTGLELDLILLTNAHIFILLSIVLLFSAIIQSQQRSWMITVIQIQNLERFFINVNQRSNFHSDNFTIIIYGTLQINKRYGIMIYKLIQQIQEQQNLHLFQSNQQLSILVLADWGPITNAQMQQIYPNISQSLIPLIKSGFFDCAIINGDIGYEFNSNQAHHVAVMTAIQQIGSKIPIFMNRGNHERGIVSYMFKEYFQLYDLDKFNATGFNLGPLFVMLIDPSNEVWPRERKKFTKQEIASSYKGLKKIIQKYQRKNENIIPILFVHYPLICGYPTKGHCIPNPLYGQIHPIYINLKHYYDFVIDNNIPLVISGHVHVYERSYPLISNYRSFSKEKHNYISNNSDHFFIHVIEGVSGNNDGIETDYLLDGKPYQPSAFIANHHENALGFGVITSNREKIIYSHYNLLSDKQIMLIDNFTIAFTDWQYPNPQQEL